MFGSSVFHLGDIHHTCTYTQTKTHTVLSVGCLVAGTQSVIKTQCQSRAEVTWTWRHNHLCINSPSSLFSSFSLFLFCFLQFSFTLQMKKDLFQCLSFLRKSWIKEETMCNSGTFLCGVGVFPLCDTQNLWPPQLSPYRHISHYRHIMHVLPLLSQLEELDYIISESDNSSLTFIKIKWIRNAHKYISKNETHVMALYVCYCMWRIIPSLIFDSLISVFIPRILFCWDCEWPVLVNTDISLLIYWH